MNRVLAGLAAGLSLTALALPAPAMADFFIKKAKPKAATPNPQRPVKNPRRARPPEPRADTPAAVPFAGIDPLLMQQAVVEAKYSAQLDRDAETKTATLQVTNGKSGWSVNFKNCVEENRCGTMEFYTLWRVSNEANVCTVWGTEVTGDPGRTQGKPYCYVVPSLARQMHLILSTDQSPYSAIGRMTPDEAKQQMNAMIGVWAAALTDLPKAWDIAVSRCPRAGDRCGGQPQPAAVPLVSKPAPRND